MINWDAIQYSVTNAERDFDNLKVNTTSMEPIDLSEEFKNIRSLLINSRNKVFEEGEFDYANKLDYKFDLKFGLQLYKVLNEDIGFSLRTASSNDVWRYLSVHVVPDIVHSRWGLNEDHFYKSPRRIWLKTIWWYIHLSWCNNEEQTYLLLENNSTDTILQLVERPGIGYNIAIYREIMKKYSKYTDRDLFRRILKLNTARLLVISPELMSGGVTLYVEELYKDALGGIGDNTK
ncbi:hypothetical protein SAMN04488102_102159 [Alkalibacterium subtropicum]|uniref:Uncharacterized protein n=1 Tax=Alkalibacterium subtropicum TaxID=753702 RepID=A0A1I1FMJ1_9LACT|nr:hypothetical protein [Alkalibacterium subtropicum]SFC00206.1 hypothetical protein SAMN04488102_102159 [Alkalibacterium subtropicum]